jgi:hypothetical protein
MRNSWRPKWGKKGCCFMPYGSLTDTVGVGFLDLAQAYLNGPSPKRAASHSKVGGQMAATT